MISSTIHVLILVPVFFVLMKERALRRGTLRKEATETIRIDLPHAALNNLGASQTLLEWRQRVARLFQRWLYEHCTKLKFVRKQLIINEIVVEAAGVEPASENVTGQETTCLFTFMPSALPEDVRDLRSERTRNGCR